MDEAITGNVREVGFRRLSHGLFVPDPPPTDPHDDWRRTLRAWLLVLPEDAAYSGLTAARLRGWPAPMLPDWFPVVVSVPLGSPGPRRPGVVVSRLTRDAAHRPETIDGLPVDTPEEVLLRCARELGILDLVPMVDRALRLGHVSRGAVGLLGGSGRPGCRLLRNALALANPASESPWESVLRLFHGVIDVPVDVQPDIVDDAGCFVARADLRVRGTRFLHEYDGSGHRDASIHAKDLRRERRIVESGHVRRGFTAGDLVGRAGATMAEIDRALGRRSRTARLRRWNQLVGVSALSPTGRERLRNRWVRDMGRPDGVRPPAA